MSGFAAFWIVTLCVVVGAAVTVNLIVSQWLLYKHWKWLLSDERAQLYRNTVPGPPPELMDCRPYRDLYESIVDSRNFRVNSKNGGNGNGC